MQDVLTLILGGGRGLGLYPLTRRRSKPSVPLAGKYRLIDIPVSNCLNSGLNRIYVLTQYLSVSLHRHIGSTYKFDPFNRGFVEVLHAQVTNEAADWYQGTADAVRKHLRYIQEDGAEQVLVLSGDQFYRMDFDRLVESHRSSGADATLAVVPVSREQAAHLGVVGVDDHGRITALVEAPGPGPRLDELRQPSGWASRRQIPAGRDYLASMGIYLFNRGTLFDLLTSSAGTHDFGQHVFPRAVAEHHFQSYLFTGYWEDLETIRSYHAVSMALASDEPPFDFHSPEGVIYTRMRNLPASRVSAAHMDQALVSDGCTVEAGARLERSVVGVRSRIGRDVTLRDSVVFGANYFEWERPEAGPALEGAPPIGVGAGTVIKRAIVDKNCRIGRNVRIVNERGLNNVEADNYVIRDGIVVIPNRAVVPDGSVI
jgi:glucose-1-phosphate adenylyltransferase